jgi:hypothetical protein
MWKGIKEYGTRKLYYTLELIIDKEETEIKSYFP